MPDVFNNKQEPWEESGLDDFSIFEAPADAQEVPSEPEPESIPIREKTFTKELKELVDRVTSYDSRGAEAEKPDFSTDESAIRHMHALFYRVVSLDDIDGADLSFEPPVHEAERTSERIVELIHDGMKALSMPHFAILTYHLEKKCYVPSINNIGDLDVSNVFLDIDDDIYMKIMTGKSGILLTADEISGDFFLKKRFSTIAGSEDNIYFLNSFRNLFERLLAGFKDNSTEGESSCLLSPVLLVRLNEKNADAVPDEITDAISRRLSHHLFTFAHQEFNKLEIFDHGNQERLFGILEFLFNSYSVVENRLCCVVRSTGYLGNPHFFLISYLFNKIYSIISSPSCAFRIDKDRMLVFASRGEGSAIEELVMKLNEHYNDAMGLSIYDNRQRISFNDFMLNHIL